MHAIQSGYFTEQILPVARPDGRLVSVDEGVRMPPDREKIGSLKPVFKEDGVITAGNSSQVSDGAASLVLASARAVGRYNLEPIARIVTRVVIGSDPVLMLDGPIPATRLALKKAGLSLEEIDVIEINEAFASVVLAWARELQPDMEKVNPNGGAIAIGHPLGATGAILMTKLIYELERTREGMDCKPCASGTGWQLPRSSSVYKIHGKQPGSRSKRRFTPHSFPWAATWATGWMNLKSRRSITYPPRLSL